MDEKREQYNGAVSVLNFRCQAFPHSCGRALDGPAARALPVLSPGQVAMRIATWNVNSLRVRMEHLGRWLADNAVDAIALQELKLADEHFPRAEIEALGLCTRSATARRPTTASRSSRAQRPQDVAIGIPGDADPQRRVIAATVGPVRLVNVYVPNGQAVGSEKYTYKLAWLERLRAYLADAARRSTSMSSSSAISTSRRRIATCTTRRPGKARCT